LDGALFCFSCAIAKTSKKKKHAFKGKTEFVTLAFATGGRPEYRDKAATVRSCSVEQTEILKEAVRLEKHAAYQLYSDPVARKAIRRQIPDL
jgi:hypothetical protein